MSNSPGYSSPLSVLPPSKTQRRYTIGYQPKCGDCTTPAIHLSGKWLREAGFETGTVITVKIEQGCLVLVPENTQ